MGVDTFLLFGCDDPSLLPQSLKLGSLIRVYRFFGKKLSKGGDSDLLFGYDELPQSTLQPILSLVGFFGRQTGIYVLELHNTSGKLQPESQVLVHRFLFVYPD